MSKSAVFLIGHSKKEIQAFDLYMIMADLKSKVGPAPDGFDALIEWAIEEGLEDTDIYRGLLVARENAKRAYKSFGSMLVAGYGSYNPANG
jgi:hypothetical protein